MRKMTEDDHALGCLECYLDEARRRAGDGELGTYGSWAKEDVPYLERCVEMVRAYLEGQVHERAVRARRGMNRESDEECLKLIATIRERHSFGTEATRTMVERLLDNLEARIRESGDMAHDSH
jgi:hypothetical protein